MGPSDVPLLSKLDILGVNPKIDDINLCLQRWLQSQPAAAVGIMDFVLAKIQKELQVDLHACATVT